MKHSAKYNFFGIYEIFNITITAKFNFNKFQYGIINSDDQDFGIDSYSFFSSYEIVVGKNVRQQLKQFTTSMLGSKLQLAPLRKISVLKLD